MNKDICLYKLTAKSGKVYYGITADFDRRMRQHEANARRINTPLYGYIKKHGWNSISSEIICIGGISVIKQLEVSAISTDKTLWPFGFNLTKGGDGITGHKHSEATKEVLRAATKAQFENANSLVNHANAMERAKPLIRALALAQHANPETKRRHLEGCRAEPVVQKNKERMIERFKRDGKGITAGFIWITNGNQNKSLAPEVAAPYLTSGWKRGRTLLRKERI